jgi:hypothetical protein
MYDSQIMLPALQLGGWGGAAKQQLLGPQCSLQDSKLPHGTADVQVNPMCPKLLSELSTWNVPCECSGRGLSGCLVAVLLASI